MLRNLREGDTAVFGGGKQAAALRADDGDGEVNHRHQQTAEDARAHRARGDGARLLDAEVTDDLDDNNAEGEARQRVHSVVALEKAGKKRLGGIAANGGDGGDGRRRGQQRDDDQNSQKEQENGVEHLADPDENLAGAEREKQHRGEENQREQQQIQPRVTRGQDLLETHGEGRGRAARDGEERPDRQIQQAGEEHRVGAVDLLREVKQAARAAEAERRDAQQGHAHTGDEKAGDGGPDMTAGLLPHVDGEDQVSGAEEHAEEHTCHGDIFPGVQFRFHVKSPLL